MNLKSSLKSIEKKLKEHGTQIWYEMDWTEWSDEDLSFWDKAEEDKELIERGEEPYHHLNLEELSCLKEKIRVRRAYPKFQVPKHSLAYLTVEQVKEMQKTFPNVKL